MSKDILIDEMVNKLNHIDEAVLASVNDYINYLFFKQDNKDLISGMMKVAETSKSFEFLNEDDDDLYKLENLKIRLR